MTPRFVTRPYMWEHNQDVSRTINAARVNVTDEAGQLHDGVGIFSMGKPRQMLTPEAARRLALDIVAALESININPRPEHHN
ncbi:hypothetical protein BW36_00532 [Micrococcus luteus]|uniref:hypothetical protein n=1 Tax=Micrococcus luteus TaxID=1270 RepID=UPI000446D23A|nr:hypothetical protein [Micrococcus luteus]EZP43336.1 hypothetical protein BW36_00532 [Micrococcus luteus]